MAITIGQMLIMMTWLFVCNKIKIVIKLASELDLNYKVMFALTTLLFLQNYFIKGSELLVNFM